MNMMNDVLSSYLDYFVLVFLDDILIYSHILEQHVEHLEKVLAALKMRRLFAKASKCSIMVLDVEFLWQWIMPQGAAPTKEKMKLSQSGRHSKTSRGSGPSWGVPTNLTALFHDMQSWHLN